MGIRGVNYFIEKRRIRTRKIFPICGMKLYFSLHMHFKLNISNLQKKTLHHQFNPKQQNQKFKLLNHKTLLNLTCIHPFTNNNNDKPPSIWSVVNLTLHIMWGIAKTNESPFQEKKKKKKIQNQFHLQQSQHPAEPL